MQSKVLKAYEQLAIPYNARIDHKPHNAYYDRPNTLGLLGVVKGKNVLDAACGPGKYAEVLIEQGATVTGFDLSPTMIELARARNPQQGTFFVQDLALPFNSLPDSSFDAVVCALAMHYVEDWEPTIREFYRVLRPGGILVISIEHPFFDYQLHQSKAYFSTEAVSAVWSGFGSPVEVPCWRRPLGACINPIVRNGFYLDKLLEPLPTPEFEQLDPKHYKELSEFPAFMCLRAIRKP